jgi:hypothetical protein
MPCAEPGGVAELVVAPDPRILTATLECCRVQQVPGAQASVALVVADLETCVLLARAHAELRRDATALREEAIDLTAFTVTEARRQVAIEGES